jgi:hypothetical protein
MWADHAELPNNALKSVDALVSTSDPPHFFVGGGTSCYMRNSANQEPVPDLDDTRVCEGSLDKAVLIRRDQLSLHCSQIG